MKRVLITGANSGIGRETALSLARQGHRVWAGVRNPDKASDLLEAAGRRDHGLEVLALDVDDAKSVERGVAEAIEKGEGIDVLINNAGIGGSGVVEDIDIEHAQGIFETNFWGVIRCTQAVLPTMREQGGGHIINLSSFLGRVAGLGQVVYSASKWGVECLSESLAQEVAPFGIRVSVIEAGSTRTNIIANATRRREKTIQEPRPEYAAFYRRTTRLYEHGWRDAAPPGDVTRTIMQAMEDPAPKLRYACAWGADALVSSRSKMSDQEWVDLGMAQSDEEYFRRFQELFGLDISEPVTYSSNRGLRARLRRLKRRFRGS
ncbi:MAG: SDR family oxidoreductase [Myxococcota bacterium]|nr:SDR family oxidoreductase [Myxococcota bacterium]